MAGVNTANLDTAIVTMEKTSTNTLLVSAGIDMYVATVDIVTAIRSFGNKLKNNGGFFTPRAEIDLALSDLLRPMRDLTVLAGQLQTAVQQGKTAVALPGFRRAIVDTLLAARRTFQSLTTISAGQEEAHDLYAAWFKTYGEPTLSTSGFDRLHAAVVAQKNFVPAGPPPPPPTPKQQQEAAIASKEATSPAPVQVIPPPSTSGSKWVWWTVGAALVAGVAAVIWKRK